MCLHGRQSKSRIIQCAEGGMCVQRAVPSTHWRPHRVKVKCWQALHADEYEPHGPAHTFMYVYVLVLECTSSCMYKSVSVSV